MRGEGGGVLLMEDTEYKGRNRPWAAVHQQLEKQGGVGAMESVSKANQLKGKRELHGQRRKGLRSPTQEPRAGCERLPDCRNTLPSWGAAETGRECPLFPAQPYKQRLEVVMVNQWPLGKQIVLREQI